MRAAEQLCTHNESHWCLLFATGSDIPPTPVLYNEDPLVIYILTQKNKAEAVQLLDRTCAQGDSDSCYFLGGLYLKQRKRGLLLCTRSVR